MVGRRRVSVRTLLVMVLLRLLIVRLVVVRTVVVRVGLRMRVRGRWLIVRGGRVTIVEMWRLRTRARRFAREGRKSVTGTSFLGGRGSVASLLRSEDGRCRRRFALDGRERGRVHLGSTGESRKVGLGAGGHAIVPVGSETYTVSDGLPPNGRKDLATHMSRRILDVTLLGQK